jgi:translation elongation factor EF-1alpha
MANFFLKGGLNFEDKYKKVRIVIPNKVISNVTDKIGKTYESNVDDQTKSQTTQSSTYKFQLDGKIFEIIDTPGFADTRHGQDQKNIENILKKASEVNYITAIVLVINGSHARKTTTLKYVLNKLEGTVPDSLLKNLIVVLTNCDENSCNFDLKLLKGLNDKYVYYMQNSAFSNEQVRESLE